MVRHSRGGHGLIPASAGSTRCPRPESIDDLAHPRKRGEHSDGLRIATAHVGSSPQARGALFGMVSSPCRVGLIPASAGSTQPLQAFRSIRGAHPRKRGEHMEVEAESIGYVGSSPQARGAPPVVMTGGTFLGLIPASAGSTVHLPPLRMCRWAHPRKRGEHPRS